ncbi:hypothetical protein ASPZODRAFT_147359 [Penicilliopsis zonata CBS 506.65]|uniref:DUF6603 domain-containing protein n=1 Tax=Penicilliopsis zonata CBS 506.65 TaxID=1073090 RepID=A0A1L9S5C5_9EURO|nr:hypothetical protein ASPZODRAFT_147359 [Penicilliopsis zonata CBS 506.65]OJJ42373.1 hypothetical protein ASPZODRAFT_147359 [Penicilliopsis zonata CBS 506.65]
MSQEYVVQSFHVNVGAGDAAVHVRAKVTIDKDDNLVYTLDKAVLVDGGDGTLPEVLNLFKLLKALPAQYTNCKKAKWLPLDAIVITHWDTDHWKGVVSLMRDHGGDRDDDIPFLKYKKDKDKKTVPVSTIYAPDDKFPKSSFKLVEPGKDTVLVIGGHGRPVARFCHGPGLIGSDFFDGVLGDGSLPPGGTAELYRDTRRAGGQADAPAMLCVCSTNKWPGTSVLDATITETNMKSIANIIVWPGGEVTHYFAGDLNCDNEDLVAAWIGRRIPTMKLSHHGAKSSTPLDMFEMYQPKNIIISAGGKHGHPSPETLLVLFSYFATQAAYLPMTLWPTQYPHWMVTKDDGDYKMYRYFTVQPFLEMGDKKTTKKEVILSRFQQAIKTYYDKAKLNRESIWDSFQRWAADHTTNNKVPRLDAYQELVSQLEDEYNKYSTVDATTIAGASQNTTGSATTSQDQIWYVAAFQAKASSKRLLTKLFARRHRDGDFEPWKPSGDPSKRGFTESKSPRMSKTSLKAEDSIASRIKKAASRAPKNVVLAASDDEEEVIFERPGKRLGPVEISPTIPCGLCCSSFVFGEHSYLPPITVQLPTGHAFDRFLTTLPGGILGFDTTTARREGDEYLVPVHQDDRWLQWMRCWAGCKSLVAVFTDDSVDADSFHSLRLQLEDVATFSTSRLDASLGLQTKSPLGIYPGLATIGFGMEAGNSPWTAPGKDIFAKLREWLVWNPQGPSGIGQAMVEATTWQLQAGPSSGTQRGSAIWFTPALNKRLTVRLEFSLASKEQETFRGRLRAVLGAQLGDALSVEEIGMTFKWQSTLMTSKGTDAFVQGTAWAWLHCKLVIAGFSVPLDVCIDVIREDSLPSAVTIQAAPNFHAIQDILRGLGALVSLPSLDDINGSIPGSFFPKIAFRRLILESQGRATQGAFSLGKISLDLEASFHQKKDNGGDVSVNLSIACQPGNLQSLSFQASLWTPNLPPLKPSPPYQIMPAYEAFKDFGPQSGAAASVSLLDLLPGVTVPQPPAGIPTDIVALGIAYENETVRIWGTIEDCSLPATDLPVISLDHVALDCFYSLAAGHAWGVAFELAVEIQPPAALMHPDVDLGASLLCGRIAYASSSGWKVEASVMDLTLAHLWQFFQPQHQKALVTVLSAIGIRQLSLQYSMEAGQNASGFTMTGLIDVAAAHLKFNYEYSSNGPWKIFASLQTDPVAQDITLGSLLRALSPGDGLLGSIIDLVGGIVLVKSGTSPGLTLQVKPESHTTPDGHVQTTITLLTTIKVGSLSVTYCQYTAAAEHQDSSPPTLRRLLLVKMESFTIPMPDVPLLKQLEKPFDSLFVLWTDHDIPESTLAGLDSSFAEACSLGQDDESFQAGLHTGIIANGQVLLKHCFGESKEQAKEKASPEPGMAPSILHPSIFATDREIQHSSKTSSTKYSKKLGPLRISSLGLKFHDGQILVVVDALLQVGPVEMELLDFGLALDLRSLAGGAICLKPSLAGLGLAVQSPPLTLAGSLLRKDTVLAGGVLAALDPYLFQAMGAYGTVAGIKTAFMILSVGGPLLNINGVMISDVVAGFGYNSDLRFPDPQAVSSFPLLAMGQPQPPIDPLQTFQDLMKESGWISPTEGSFWVGAGLKASAFNMLDAKIAAVVKIQHSRLSQIGLFVDCIAQMPKKPAPKPFVSLELGIMAVVDLVQGSILVAGALAPTSYVLDPACHLTGGFAASTWFDPSPYAGEWVFTLGGYHPHFTPPVYYPRDIAAVGIVWQVDERIFVRAGAYFAITPKLCMGGAAMLATCDVAGLHASFSALIDFLMNFEPFHYVLDVAIDISVSWSGYVLCIWTTIGVDITADLHMCGPPVYGTFTIKAPIKNVTVEFGDPSGRNVPGPVDLARFRQMLQQSGQGERQELKISCRAGMLMEDGEQCWRVRAGTFVFEVKSNVATTQPFLNNEPVGNASSVFATPMHLTNMTGGLEADLKVNITSPEGTEEFQADQISGGLPAALWSVYNPLEDPSSPSSNKSALLDGSSPIIPSVYGLGVRMPQARPCEDAIQPFPVSCMTNTITITPPPIPSPREADASWEGVDAPGKTNPEKREAVQGIWRNPPMERQAFSKTWIEAMGWSDCALNPQSPERLLNQFDSFVRGTPLVSVL